MPLNICIEDFLKVLWMVGVFMHVCSHQSFPNLVERTLILEVLSETPRVHAVEG